ncbi:MAG TPA: FxLYD domain-containing protein [Bordetella sp.]
MNARFAALLLLALASGPACAQNLRHDPAVYALTATRDLTLGQTTITGSYTNGGYATQPAPKITFALYDADDHEVGRLIEHAEADLAPGQTWDIRATTPLLFARYLPMTDAPPPVAAPVSLGVRRAPRRSPALAKAPATTANPAPKKTVIYRKPELYDWSKHHRPVSTTAHGSTVRRASPAVRPGYVPRKNAAPSTRSVR